MILPGTLAKAMRDQARRALPRECCGLLIGTPGRIVRMVPAPNCHTEPERFFTIDPAVQFNVLRELRGLNEEQRLIGHYHSHPAGPAAPSERDLADANDPALVWLLIDAKSGEIAAFEPQADAEGKVTGFTRLTLREE